MKSADQIKKFFKNAAIDTNPEVDKAILNKAFIAHEETTNTKSAVSEPNIRSKIMKNPITKLAIAAVIIIAAIICANQFGIFIDVTTPTWALDQTIKALEETRNCVISGINNTDLRSIPFTCKIKSDDLLLFESDAETYVINEGKYYLYSPAYGEVLVTESEDPKGYHEVLGMKIWTSGSTLKQLREISDNWNEVYEKDPQTGKDSVFVTCTAMNRSIWFQFDVETKLVVRGKLWHNLEMQGTPEFETESILYNTDMPDGTFDFKFPSGVKIVSEEEHKKRKELLAKAWELENKKKQYEQAIEPYQEIYEKYPTWEYAPWSLERIADIYRYRLEQFDKAIELYEKIIDEYPQLSYRLLRTYKNLGYCYMKTGQNDKALKALKTCLELGRERNRGWFVFDKCQEMIAKLEKNQK
jgi:outer membrane lipoprotein-sorting protein